MRCQDFDEYLFYRNESVVMIVSSRFFCTSLLWLCLVTWSESLIGKQVEQLRLPDASGEVIKVTFQDDAELTVVCFLGTECPLAKLYGPRLQTMAESLKSRVRFVGIISNRQDSIDDVRNYVRRHGIGFSMLKDYDNVVADQFAAQRTPEVFVIDRNRDIRYRGRIDDQ